MKIVSRIVIEAAPEVVFSWIGDPDRARRWMASVTHSEIIEETPDRIGTTFREYIEEDGRGLEMHGVVTAFVADERFAVHLESEVNTVHLSFDLVERAGVTELTQRVDLRLKGLLKLATLLLSVPIKRKVRVQVRSELGKLKQLCERDLAR